MKGVVEDYNDDGIYEKLRIYPLIQGGILCLAGLILLLFPKLGLIFLSITFGLYLLLQGIGQTVLAFQISDIKENWWQMLIRAILFIIAGVLILWFPFSFAKIGMGIPLVTGGIFLIISNLQDLLQAHPAGMGKGKSGSIIMLLLGILLCFAPVFSALLLFRIIGIFTLAGGLLIILYTYGSNRCMRFSKREKFDHRAVWHFPSNYQGTR